MDEPKTGMQALREEDLVPPMKPLAYGCVLCKTVVSGQKLDSEAPCPFCHERLGGTLEPLMPLGMVIDLLREVKGTG